MAGDDDASILAEIQEKYVPFLKKLISFLERTKKATPDSLNRLKTIHAVFTTASIIEQIDVFHTNKKKLEKWYKSYQKDKANEEAAAAAAKSSKRSIVLEDTDSSQGAFEVAAKKAKVSEPTISSVRSVDSPPTKFDANVIAQIKQEKVDKPKVTTTTQPVTVTVTPTVPEPQQAPQPTAPNNSQNENDDDAVVFTCASCQFQTNEEQEFMKHTRTDHRSDLSMWCKQCGKCFSNAGVLVSHIKERACLREEMIYKCGVKDCTFETSSGQTFVHHLRHCHKGSPFIFCVHCQKIFTLPHCLILHMQDDCPYKNKNRRNPSDDPSPPVAANAAPKISTVTPSIQVPTTVPPPTSFTPRPPTISSVTSAVPKASPATPRPTRGRGFLPTSRGRGRGRGRGRAWRHSDSSDSDADDPSWRPEESTDQPTLRRSGRWAKKVNDVINIQPKEKSQLSMSEINDKEMLKCACCDFLAAFKSVLNDHYIAHHKVPNKNACLVCHLKFESTPNFLEHFADHASGKIIQFDLDKCENSTNATNKTTETAKTPPPPISETTLEKEVPPTANLAPLEDKEMYKDVLHTISEAKVFDPTSDESKYVKIPYQAAVHDKQLKETKGQSFEDLKSPSDLLSMRNEEKLKCFYKCIMHNCDFTTNDSDEYMNHLETSHKGKILFCCYCHKEHYATENLIQHIVSEHGKRQYQCNSCFYRAYSYIHVQIHIKHHHPKDPSAKVYTCDPIKIPPHIEIKGNEDEVATMWPYICAIGDCKFQTYDPKDFKDHNDTSHKTVSAYFCYYCKVQFFTFKRLLDHYRLHGINTFQCNYCIHGAETKDDIMLHLCNMHLDQPLRVFIRGEDGSKDARVVPYSVGSETNQNNQINEVDGTRSDSPSVENVDVNRINFEAQLYDVVGETYYPRHLGRMCTDLTCGVPWCHEKLESISSYIDHLKTSHSAMNACCPHCPFISDTWSDFIDHLMCHGPELYACGLVTCNFYYWDKTLVAEHLKEHNQMVKVVIIRECAQETERVNEIDQVSSLPEISPLLTSGDSYQCFFCRYKSTDKQVMKNHMYREMAYKRFSCSYCSKKFVSRKDIKSHCDSEHSGDIKCSIFSNSVIETIVKRILKEKIKSPDTKSIPCPVCNKNFKSPIQWQRHMCLCVQSQYQPYDCGYCSFHASDLKVLKFHTDQKHPSKPVLFTEVSSDIVEAEIEKKLQQVRLAYLNKILGTENHTNESKNLIKFYVCSACSYESNHKYNTKFHIKELHTDTHAEIRIVMKKNPDSLNVNDNTTVDDNTKSANKSSSGTKRYRCGFCIKKLHTLEELEKHVESLHPVRDEVEYSYYYSPDPKSSFPVSDQELYECSYCKSGKENLHSLKIHSDLMHSESPFKVKGYVIRNRDKSSILSCGYCYLRVHGMSELKRHTSTEHPSQPQKSLGGYSSSTGKKRDLEEADGLPYKKVKFGSVVFVCGHCGGAFSRHEDVAAHSRKSHSRLALEFTKKSLSEEKDSMEFYKCEFCKFTSQKDHLETHIKTKHKMRVTCGYCNKRFEFATKLREHHNVVHKGLPLKYSQETMGSVYTKKDRTHSVSSDDYQATNRARKATSSKYRKSNPIDLSRIYMHILKDNSSARISVLTFSKMHNIFPSVCLEDIKNLK